MEINTIESIVEGILFTSGEPVAISKISAALDVELNTISRLINNMIDKYNLRNSGLKIVRLEDMIQMCTREEYGEYIKRALDFRRNTVLSNAAMEVLAIIAYNQPVTRMFVEQIRGVDCASIINNLIEKGLIVENGKLDAPGRPYLYGTSPEFLRCFGIESLSQLPDLENGAANAEELREG